MIIIIKTVKGGTLTRWITVLRLLNKKANIACKMPPYELLFWKVLGAPKQGRSLLILYCASQS